jgi:DNA polymerase-3 subunit beta
LQNCNKILDGEFLNYSSVIPEKLGNKNKINKNILQNCFERISLISSSSIEKEKKYPVKVTIDVGKITISCTNQTGDAKEEMYIRKQKEKI